MNFRYQIEVVAHGIRLLVITAQIYQLLHHPKQIITIALVTIVKYSEVRKLRERNETKKKEQKTYSHFL